MDTRPGSFRLFRTAGIDVFLHWSWFVVAAVELTSRSDSYGSPVWNVLEYLTLFGIVLAHEFGHALACRSVGGEANQIVLWPLGGVAYVSPPSRPGATLWSIAAGPLVNAVLLPLFFGLLLLSGSLGWAGSSPNLHAWLRAGVYINAGLLLFNLLPVYPLDGGQILRALLWFVIGRARSLLVATVIGFIGVAGLLLLAIKLGSPWFVIMAAFLLMGCWRGMKHALALNQLARLPRRPGLACPRCAMAPPLGEFWTCSGCSARYDLFGAGALCPRCGQRAEAATCFDCGEERPPAEWLPGAAENAPDALYPTAAR